MHIRQESEQISVFVIDAYTDRILARLGLTTNKPGYTALQALYSWTIFPMMRKASTMPSLSGMARRHVNGLPFAITAA